MYICIYIYIYGLPITIGFFKVRPLHANSFPSWRNFPNSIVIEAWRLRPYPLTSTHSKYQWFCFYVFFFLKIKILTNNSKYKTLFKIHNTFKKNFHITLHQNNFSKKKSLSKHVNKHTILVNLIWFFFFLVVLSWLIITSLEMFHLNIVMWKHWIWNQIWVSSI